MLRIVPLSDEEIDEEEVADLLQDAQENINQPTAVEEEMNPLNDENYSVDNDAEDNPENCEENLGNFDDEIFAQSLKPIC